MPPAAAGLMSRALCAALALIAGSLALGDALRYPAAPTRIEITATPITSFDNRDPTRTRFGDLEFRGGLELSSRHPAFGGISALHVEPDGNHFIAATDRGSWLRGRIVYRDGKPAGIADAEIAPILGADGRPLAARGWYDVESLAERDGILYIGIERAEQIVRFDYRRDGLLCTRAADRRARRFQDVHLQQESRMPCGATAGRARRRVDRGDRAQPRQCR